MTGATMAAAQEADPGPEAAPAPDAPAPTAEPVDDWLDSLAESRDAAEAYTLERLIWTAWLSYDGEAEGVAEAMDRGNRLMRASRLEEAEAAFAEAIEGDPAYAEAWNRRATVRYLRGDYAGSIADIRAVLALQPRHFGALSGLGLCLVALDRPADALDAFEAGLDVHPFMPGPRAQVDRLREILSGDPI
ncbi:MAG: tetratricopeptide repeat protein [Azospirillaceae bacterium]